MVAHTAGGYGSPVAVRGGRRGLSAILSLCLVCVLCGPALASAEQERDMQRPLSIESRVELHDGFSMPLFGLGTFQADGHDAYRAVLAALKHGYRHIDTASLYGNEEHVGRAIRDSGIQRRDVFVTTKVFNHEQGFENTLEAVERSLTKLRFDYIDLYLIHAPVPERRVETWMALEHLKATGKVRSIGVSNYNIKHLREAMEVGHHVPAVNQIEIHPWLVRQEVIDFCREHDIVVEGYSPLAKAERLHDPELVDIARLHGKSPAQVLLRWSLQHGYVTIPKSTSPDRIRENADVFDFELTSADMDVLDAKHEGMATGWNPVEDPAYD